TYVAQMGADTHGFGASSGIFFRLSGAIDPTTLPATPLATLDSAASVYVVDLARGARVPVRVRFRADAGRFAGPDLLAILPVAGLPLRPHTRYAAVVTRHVRDVSGVAVTREPGFTQTLGKPLLAPLVDWARQAGVLDDIAGATVFTTGEYTSDMQAL